MWQLHTASPVPPKLLQANVAVCGLTKALKVGEILTRHEGSVEERYYKVIEYLGGGQIVDRGIVSEATLERRGGFNIGKIYLFSLTCCNGRHREQNSINIR
ncbi:MAG: hypothetical protein QXK88_06120 [Desulfurococcaceae archaeon]